MLSIDSVLSSSPPVAGRPRRALPLGLPAGIAVCLFDLDGVLVQTARLHAQASKAMFDRFLQARALRTGDRFVPFELERDFAEHVDGRPRIAGVRSFLAARGIELPDGRADDPAGVETVAGLAARKNELVLGLFDEHGVEAYPGSVRYVQAVRAAGMRCAVVSSSTHGRRVLAAAGIAQLFDQRLDGLDVERLHLKGKPAPDSFLAAVQAFGASPLEAAVFEDAPAGVAAGRAGSFGFVVGVDRGGRAQVLRDRGADVVVSDLGDLLEAA